MRINIRNSRNHNSVQYQMIRPIPDDNNESDLIANWHAIYQENQVISQSFFEIIDPLLHDIVGQRGQIWDYVTPINIELDWPHEFEIYLINRV